MEPARPSAAFPVSTETTVDVTVLAGNPATLVGDGDMAVTSCVAVRVAIFPPWPGRTMFLMATYAGVEQDVTNEIVCAS
jgi:hypothetical protein